MGVLCTKSRDILRYGNLERDSVETREKLTFKSSVESVFLQEIPVSVFMQILNPDFGNRRVFNQGLGVVWGGFHVSLS